MAKDSREKTCFLLRRITQHTNTHNVDDTGIDVLKRGDIVGIAVQVGDSNMHLSRVYGHALILPSIVGLQRRDLYHMYI